ncbi:hypothetical protein ACJ73_09362, partial [Blastomyces percursus]
LVNPPRSGWKYRLEMENLDAHKLLNLSEMVHLCGVDTAEISAITAVAKAAVIPHEYPGYSCRDHVDSNASVSLVDMRMNLCLISHS